MKLAVTILCRDEADVIWDCFCIHSDIADNVYITDNRSVDGTRGIISRAHATIIDEPGRDYQQATWLMRMQQMAADDGCDWIMHVDADEIYVGNIREVLDATPHTVGAIRVPGRVFVPTVQDDQTYPYIYGRMRYYDPSNTAHRKMILRIRACNSVLQGNHDADLKKGFTISDTKSIRIDHYPDRTFEQFARKYIQGGEAYANSKFPKGVGWHWREKYEAYKRGGMEALKDEWLKIYRTNTEGLIYAVTSGNR